METLEERVAKSIRAARIRLGLTQADLARLATAVGASWTQSKVAAMETGRRDIGLGEALTLGNLLGVGLHELVLSGATASPVSVGGVGLTSEQLQRMLAGSPVLAGDEGSADVYIDVMTTALRRRIQSLVEEFEIVDRENVLEEVEAAAHGPAERAAARRLQVTPEEVASAAIALWGRSLTAERRARTRAKSGGDVLRELEDLHQRR